MAISNFFPTYLIVFLFHHTVRFRAALDLESLFLIQTLEELKLNKEMSRVSSLFTHFGIIPLLLFSVVDNFVNHLSVLDNLARLAKLPIQCSTAVS